MKTVISTESGHVAEHFGRCPEFTVVEYADGKLIKEEVVTNPGHHPGYLPVFLRNASREYCLWRYGSKSTIAFR